MIGWVLMRATGEGQDRPLSVHSIEDFGRDDVKRRSAEEPNARFYLVEIDASDFDDR